MSKRDRKIQALLDQYDALFNRYFELMGWPINDENCEIINLLGFERGVKLIAELHA